MIFLPNATLLETSCVETYRIAHWEPDKRDSSSFRVFEDGALAFTATVLKSTPTVLRIERKLAHGSEKATLEFQAQKHEFLCPGLHR